MKKSGLLLLAALSLTLTSCGTKYVAKNDENTTLQLSSSSFTLTENIEEETINILITRYTYSKYVSYKFIVSLFTISHQFKLPIICCLNLVFIKFKWNRRSY